MTTSVQTLPAGSPNHFSARPLWAAIAVLGVAVIALGASLIHIQTRPLDGHAVFATSDPAALLDDAAPVAAATELPVTTVAPDEAVLPPRPTPVTTTPVVPRNLPKADAEPVRPQAQPAATNRPANPAATVATVATAPQAQPMPAPAPAPAVPTAPYVVTESGVVLSQPVSAPMARSVCANCGRVESVTPVQRQGQAQGTGAVAGGVLGAVVGNQIGKGGGRAVATILGAVGGGLAGNTIEKNMATVTVYLVRIRMEDGTVRSVEQASAPAIGASVVVDGQSLRSADGARVVSSSDATAAPVSPQAKVYGTDRN